MQAPLPRKFASDCFSPPGGLPAVAGAPAVCVGAAESGEGPFGDDTFVEAPSFAQPPFCGSFLATRAALAAPPTGSPAIAVTFTNRIALAGGAACAGATIICAREYFPCWPYAPPV